MEPNEINEIEVSFTTKLRALKGRARTLPLSYVDIYREVEDLIDNSPCEFTRTSGRFSAIARIFGEAVVEQERGRVAREI